MLGTHVVPSGLRKIGALEFSLLGMSSNILNKVRPLVDLLDNGG
jgi:hypothetical protein